jgi:hypothetical protein
MATIKKIATELNWVVDKKTTWGKVNGFTVSLLQNTDLTARQPSYKTMVVSYDEIDQAKAEALVEFISQNKKALKVINYKVSGTYLNVFINEGLKGLNATNLMEALQLLVTGFQQIGISPPSVCVYCKEETIEEVITNRITIRAHQTCYNHASEQINEAKSDVKYGMGILGALLGAFAGSLIFFVVYIIGWILPLTTVAIGFATFLGYKLLGGTFTEKAKVIIAIVSVVSVLASIGLVVLMEAVFLDVSFTELLSDPNLGYASPFGFAILWGLAGSSSGYGLAKRRQF